MIRTGRLHHKILCLQWIVFCDGQVVFNEFWGSRFLERDSRVTLTSFVHWQMGKAGRKSVGDGASTPSPASKKARIEDYARPTMLPDSEVGVELMKQWMSGPHWCRFQSCSRWFLFSWGMRRPPPTKPCKLISIKCWATRRFFQQLVLSLSCLILCDFRFPCINVPSFCPGGNGQEILEVDRYHISCHWDDVHTSVLVE